MRKLQLNEVKHVLSKLGHIPIFHYLSDDEKWQLLDICEIYEYFPDEKIINQGEVGNCFYSILMGNVNVTVMDSSTGKEIFMSMLGEGDFFGEAAIFSNGRRTANVIAADYTEILCIKRTDLFSYITRYKSAGIKILMFFIDGLLKKLNVSNQELAFERREVLEQTAIDQFLQTLDEDNNK